MNKKVFDIKKFTEPPKELGQYERQLQRLISAGKEVQCIEEAVRGALKNLSNGTARKSFVIYGEPQSGKTEMMICLTAKLLDAGKTFVLHLLNDSVDLLGQNLGRFQDSGLAPSAQNFTEILDPEIDVKKRSHVIFAKKNARDLQKLFNKIGHFKNIIIIDDEADFASPNSKVNKAEKTRINDLISSLLGNSGDYIGVTATPARLDLNNTFDNDNKLWVNFPPHQNYTGQNIFFPLDGPREPPSQPYDFQLNVLPENGDAPKHTREAIFSFLANVAYLNTYVNEREENYSMLIHTSGKKIDHKSDWSVVNDVFSVLANRTHVKFAEYIEAIWSLAHSRYTDADADKLTSYLADNITRNALIILNSDRDFIQSGQSATRPTSLFTIVIGGNIVSRGVTFENLLSMFFTRDVRHKIQQDTYIQRARMFGSRGKYLKFFELSIPRALYADWHRCFVFHQLALEAIREGMGSPVWLSDHRISVAASSSIDRSTVDLDKGEMAFKIFKFESKLDRLAEGNSPNSKKLDELSEILGNSAFPPYLKRFIVRTSPNLENALAVHNSSSIDGYRQEPGLNKSAIERRRGFFGKPQMEPTKYPHAIHHLKIFTNAEGNGRLFYKFNGSIQFIKNLK